MEKYAKEGTEEGFTATQSKLMEMWKQILEVDHLTIDDNFFSLGGHSLKIIALEVQVEEVFDIQLELSDLFKKITIRDLAQHIDQLEQGTYSVIQPVEEQEYYPVSYAQRALFLQSQVQDVGIAYNTPQVYEVNGKLDLEKLQSSINILVHRHESLRTTFKILQGEVVMEVHPGISGEIAYYETNSQDVELIVKEQIRPFDLSTGPLFRVVLIKLAERRQILILDMHHIITDGISSMIFLSELIRLYTGEYLPELKLQYKDYASWQNQQLASDALDQQRGYWLDTFAGDPPTLAMPLDYQRPEQQSFTGDVVDFIIPATVTSSLNQLAEAQQTTLNRVMLALYALLLSKYTGQDDLVIGSVVAGRHHNDLENIIGMFINNLPIRIQLDPTASLADLIRSSDVSILAAYANQDYPFGEIVNQVVQVTDHTRNPLYDTMFVFHNEGQESQLPNIPGLQISGYQGLEEHGTMLDFSLVVNYGEEGLNCKLSFNTQLFKKESMERMARHFCYLLEQVPAVAHLPLNQIGILPPDEQEKICKEFIASQVHYTDFKPLHCLFQEQVERTPDRVALVYEEQVLTYRELNIQANQLARFIVAQGARVEQPVGILLDRSLEMIVGILAILKAGGAYVPIDPDYPSGRIKFVLEDSGVELLLTQSWLTEKINFNGGILQLDLLNLDAEDGTNLDLEISSRNLAYIIYTSGSTGQPKGVMIEHRSVVNLVQALKDVVYNSDDCPLKVALVAPYVFDASVQQIFTALLFGDHLYLVPDQVRRSGQALLQFYNDYKIDLTDGTPTHLQMLVDMRASWVAVEHFVIGGEALPGSLVEKIFTQYQDRAFKITNVYGPTECCVDATHYLIERGTFQPGDQIPIGRPLATTKALVLDQNLLLQPIGVVGELYISGAGLARGYLNQPSLTGEKFIDNPWFPGEKMYRTGDLVKWLPDGNLLYLGRMDHQVKVMGYRIELGEIETVLRQHSAIQQVVVVTQVDEEGTKYLATFYTADQPVSPRELKKYLRSQLPFYMIPSQLTQLEKMPLLESGKIDRKSLQALSLEKEAVQLVQPRNALEDRLLAMWRSVLKREQLGVQTDFFTLGGNSLKAMSLISKIQQEMQVDVPLGLIFNQPTITELAQFILKAQENKFRRLQKLEIRDYYPTSSAQKRIYALCQIGSPTTHYNIPMIFSIEGNLDLDRFETAMQTLVKRHEVLRTSFSLQGAELYQIIHDPSCAKVIYQESRNQEMAREQATTFIQPFDLHQPPLFRAGLIKFESDKYLLVFDIHHIISDAHSNRILMNEFIQLYNGIELPAQEIQYKEFADWQNQLFRSEKFQKQERYWLEMYQGEIPKLNLPLDYQRPELLSFIGQTMSRELELDLTGKLEELVATVGVTSNMLFFAAFNVLLAHYACHEEVVVGMPIAGRTHVQLENVVGMFLNTLAIKSRPARDKTFLAYLLEIKDVLVDSYENQDYQFDMLIEKLQIKREANRNPLFDVAFVYLDEQREIDQPELNGDIRMSSYGVAETISKFDLTLYLFRDQDQIKLTVEYAVELFTEETISRFIDHYIKLLSIIVKQREILIENIELEELKNPSVEIEEVVFDFA